MPPDKRSMTPLTLSAYTLVTANGRGIGAVSRSLRDRRTGLRPCNFEDALLKTYIGRVDGLEDFSLGNGLAPFDCRNNRLAWLLCNKTDSWWRWPKPNNGTAPIALPSSWEPARPEFSKRNMPMRNGIPGPTGLETISRHAIDTHTTCFRQDTLSGHAWGCMGPPWLFRPPVLPVPKCSQRPPDICRRVCAMPPSSEVWTASV